MLLAAWLIWTARLALQYGVHAAVTMILGIRLALVALGWTLGHASAWVMCLFILCNRVVSEALCRLFPMVCAVTTMMPCYLPLRSRSMYMCVWSWCAVRGRFHRTLWMKTCTSRAANAHSPHPSSRWCTSFQSFPNRWRQCSGVCSAVRQKRSHSGRHSRLRLEWVVNRYGWLPSTGGPPKPHDTDGVSDGSGSFVPAGEATPADPLVWNLLLGVVTVCVALQLAMWSLYTLKGPHLKRVKRMAAQLPDEGTAQDAEAPSKYDQ